MFKKQKVHQTKPIAEEGYDASEYRYGLRHDVGQFLNAQPVCTSGEGTKWMSVKKPGGNKRGY